MALPICESWLHHEVLSRPTLREHRLIVDVRLTAENTVDAPLLEADLLQRLERSLLVVLVNLRDAHTCKRGEALGRARRSVTGKGDDLVLDCRCVVLGQSLRVSYEGDG